MKIKTFLLGITLAFCSLSASAYDIEDNGIYYNVVSLQDMTVAIAGVNVTGDVVIPSTITYNGRTFTVTKIAEIASLNGVNNITFPSTIKEIVDNAIYVARFDEPPLHMYFPSDNQIEKIGSKAIQAYSKSIIADIPLPNLKEYSITYAGIIGENISISIPKNAELHNDYWLISKSFGQHKKLVFDKASSDTIKFGPKYDKLESSAQEELYYGRSIFVTDWSNTLISKVLFTNIKKLTIPVTEDGVYYLDPIQLDDVDTLICYVPTPPASIRATTSKTYMNAKVFVPDESVAQYKAHSIWGQFWNILPMSELGEKSKCVTPTISYADNKLNIESSTSGSKCYYTISDADVVSNAVVNGDISLTSTYKITAYAMADGYENSDVASATLCYIDGTFSTDGVENVRSAKRAIVLSSNNGTICVSGLECGEEVSLYSIDGQKESSVIATSSSAILEGKSLLSKVGIVKVGNSNVKLLIK